MRALSILALALAATACASPQPASPEPEPAAPEARAEEAAPAPGPAAPAEARTAPVEIPGVTTGSLPGDRVPEFRVSVRRTADGRTVETPLDSRAAGGPVLYLVVSGQCGYCNEDAPRMREVEDAFLPKGLTVVYLYPVRAEPDAEKLAWHAAKGLRGGLVLDADAAVARALEAAKTPTAYLVDRDGLIVYRGAVALPSEGGGAPEAHLARAVGEHLAGKPVTESLTEPEG